MEIGREINITEFKRYLLGDLPPTETETIDLQIISDENFEEELFWAESELIEDYLDDTLSPAEVKLFKENFLVSKERLAQFKQLSLLRNYALNAAPKESLEKSYETIAPDGFLKKIKNLFALNWRLTAAAFALIAVGLFSVFYLTANRQTAAEIEFAALNQKDLGDLAQYQSLSNTNLMSGVFRDSGSAGKLAENKLTEKVLFRLALPVQSNAPEKFRAELVKNGKTIFTLTDLPFYTNPSGQELRLLLPAAELKKGNYEIKLTKQTMPDAVYVYNFAVE